MFPHPQESKANCGGPAAHPLIIGLTVLHLPAFILSSDAARSPSLFESMLNTINIMDHEIRHRVFLWGQVQPLPPNCDFGTAHPFLHQIRLKLELVKAPAYLAKKGKREGKSVARSLLYGCVLHPGGQSRRSSG